MARSIRSDFFITFFTSAALMGPDFSDFGLSAYAVSRSMPIPRSYSQSYSYKLS